MRLERRHHQQDLALEGKARRAPLHRLLDARHHGVNPLADFLKDRPSEGRGIVDIGIDPGLAAHNMPPPSISRTTPMPMTSRFRFRPAVPREIIPTAAPIIASGMISQLSHPSSGRKAMRAQTSATKPMI